MSESDAPIIEWASPKSPLRPESLKVDVLVDNPPQFSPETQAAIAKSWDPNLKNGLLATLISCKVTPDGHLSLVTGLTNYRTQTGIHSSSPDQLRMADPELLKQGGIVVAALVTTSDNYLVLGDRPKGNSTIPSIFGGTANRDESSGPLTNGQQFFDLISLEIQEELGIPGHLCPADKFGLIALLVNPSTLRPLLLFRCRLDLTFQQVARFFSERGNKSEHHGISPLSWSKVSISSFLSTHPDKTTTTPATLDSFRFVLKEMLHE